MIASEKGRCAGGVAARAVAEGDWSLEDEILSRRVSWFAAFVEAPEGGEGALTEAQREFLDEFSSGLAEAIAEERD